MLPSSSWPERVEGMQISGSGSGSGGVVKRERFGISGVVSCLLAAPASMRVPCIYIFVSITHSRRIYSDLIIHTELDPVARLDRRRSSSARTSSYVRFLLLPHAGVGRLRIEAISSCVSCGALPFFPPGLCLYHVALGSIFLLDPHFLQVHR